MPTSTDAPLRALLAALEREIEAAVALRHRLHERPERSHAEHETSAAVAAELPVEAERAAGTGLIARVGAGARPVAVRAELDGLPIAERTDAPFSARGETMHACGHDVHMAALVALTRAVHSLGDGAPAPLAAVFQPSEEAYPSGALQLREQALAAVSPRAVVAAHVHPELPWGSLGLEPGTVNASCDAFEIEIRGEPTHGAYPHLGRDPVLALSEVVVALHAAAGRRIDPLAPSTLTVAVLEAGTAENLIPAAARARGALRAYRDEDREALRELAAEVAAGIARAHGCTAQVRIVAGEPPLRNDTGIVTAARELLAQAGFVVAPPWRSCGSDDFSFFGALAPVAMAFVGLGGAPGFPPRPLHHPELLPPDDAVSAVARAQAALYLAAAGSLA